IAAEAYWFDNLPMTMRGFIPQYLGSQNSEGKISYRLEYLYLTALNELFVFSKLPSQIWQKILASAVEFLSLCLEQPTEPNDPINTLDILFADKTTLRLNEFCASRRITLEKKWQFAGQDVSLAQILRDSQKHLPNGEPLLGVLHGDFCFSNILYDFRDNKIKTIDPRGMTPDGQKTLYGDIRYDLAKLSHSILGLYDWIIAGYYHVEIADNAIELKIAEQSQHKETQQGFIELIEQTFGLTAKNLYAMQIQLFLSMLPLHADDRHRQDALFANAFRLHQIL
nr:capsular biosynthesis protein [Vibrio anguillarum]